MQETPKKLTGIGVQNLKKDGDEKNEVKPRRKSLIPATDNLVGEETEIITQIMVPTEGGWGWVVLVCAFFGVAIVDGLVFTFGALLTDISKDLKIVDSLGALLNSVEVAMYFILSPLGTALINNFGFRIITVTGSIICSVAHFLSYFTRDFTSLLLLYGIINGFGCSLLNLCTNLVVGFHFEKLRSLALAFVSTGSSIGIMAMYPINAKLVAIAGWRTTILLHSGMYGLVYFLGLSFQPLLSLTVAPAEVQGSPTKTVTYLPSIAAVSPTKKTSAAVLQPTATEKIIGAVSNAKFPTGERVIQETLSSPQGDPSAAGTSAAGAITIQVTTEDAVSPHQVKIIKSIVSTTTPDKQQIKIDVDVQKPQNTSCFGRCCNWKRYKNRPMYRDDVFYHGKIENLPVYRKSVLEVPEDERTGVDYQLAVSRAAAVSDLQEKNRGVLSTAVRRVLATMLDPRLLKRGSFLFFCSSSFLSYIGVLVPYVFLQDRGLQNGVDATHASFFVSVLSFSNMLGKVFLSWLSMKVNCLFIYGAGLIVAGICTIFSSLSYSLVYQYGYSGLFGFAVASCTTLRCIVVVAIYGLENLTNATGMILMFNGIASLIGTPLAGVLKNSYGYETAFYVSGAFIFLAGLLTVPMKMCLNKEEQMYGNPNKQNKPDKETNTEIQEVNSSLKRQLKDKVRFERGKTKSSDNG